MPLPADPSIHVALFAHHACRSESAIDLGLAALLIAEPEYPDLDIGHYQDRLDQLAQGVAPRLADLTTNVDRALAVVGYLLDEQGFCGNLADYHDPRNSFLNEVLDRRLGIPITLAVVAIEVARRCQVQLQGVLFPGHFLLRAEDPLSPTQQATFINPFTAQTLDSADLSALLQQVIGQRRPIYPGDLRVATKQAILVRMLNNLRAVYQQQGDLERHQLAKARIAVLSDSALRTDAAHEGGVQ